MAKLLLVFAEGESVMKLWSGLQKCVQHAGLIAVPQYAVTMCSSCLNSARTSPFEVIRSSVVRRKVSHFPLWGGTRIPWLVSPLGVIC